MSNTIRNSKEWETEDKNTESNGLELQNGIVEIKELKKKFGLLDLNYLDYSIILYTLKKIKYGYQK